MSLQLLQENRFELKYIIPERIAREVRQFARSYLVPDPHADPETVSYNIHSIYLDSNDLALCRSTVQGHKNRFKLRVRYYNDDPASPVFFEIKRRVNDNIRKRRAAVKRPSVLPLLDGHWPHRSDLVDENDGKALEALGQFCDLRGRIWAQPQVIVSYNREAWVSPRDNSIRLTFDRELTATEWTRRLVTDVFGKGLRVPVPGVILELKFTDRFPNWMRTMVQVFNLRRQSMAKYVQCMRVMRSPHLFVPRISTEAVI